MNKEELEKIKIAWQNDDFQDVSDLIEEVERLQEENEHLKNYLKHSVIEAERYINGMKYLLE